MHAILAVLLVISGTPSAPPESATNPLILPLWKCVQQDGKVLYTNMKEDLAGKQCSAVNVEAKQAWASDGKPATKWNSNLPDNIKIDKR